jgi:hypothetical protein
MRCPQTSTAAVSMIVAATATVRRLTTTPLLTTAESVVAMGKAASTKQAYAAADSGLGQG